MNLVKFKKPKTKNDIARLPFVDKIVNEGEDGYWVYLKEGYRSTRMECSTIHEPTIAECIEAINDGIERL